MRGLTLLLVLLACATRAGAQEASQPPARDPVPEIDATKLGVSLARIQRQLGIAEQKDKIARDGMRLEFNVQVYGTAPKIEVLKGVDLFSGPVPGSAPSHRQFIEFVTPQIYRTPTVPISSLAGLAAYWVFKQSKKAQCEEEIANYRALVMQGVSMSAPRCTQ